MSGLRYLGFSIGGRSFVTVFRFGTVIKVVNDGLDVLDGLTFEDSDNLFDNIDFII